MIVGLLQCYAVKDTAGYGIYLLIDRDSNVLHHAMLEGYYGIISMEMYPNVIQ